MKRGGAGRGGAAQAQAAGGRAAFAPVLTGPHPFQYMGMEAGPARTGCTGVRHL